MVSENPLNSQSDFQCLQCFKKLSSEKVLEILDQSKRIAKSCLNVSCKSNFYKPALKKIFFFYQSSDVEVHERVLHLLSVALWPSHHLMIEMKSKLSHLYGSNTSKLKKPELQRKLQLLLDLCNCFDKVFVYLMHDGSIPHFVLT